MLGRLNQYFCCPICSGDLVVMGESIPCAMCEAIFPIIDGIPSLLVESKGIPVEDFQAFYEDPDAVARMGRKYGKDGRSRRMFVVQSLFKQFRPASTLEISIGAANQLELQLFEGVQVVIGVDISLAFLRRAKERFGDRVLLVQADARHLPVRPNCVDYASCQNLIEHLDDYMSCLEAITRASRDVIIVSTDAYSQRDATHYREFGEHQAGHLHVFNHFRLKEALARLAPVQAVYFYTFIPYVILPHLMNILTRSNSWGLEQKKVFRPAPEFEFDNRSHTQGSLVRTVARHLRHPGVLRKRVRLWRKWSINWLYNRLERERVWLPYIRRRDAILAPLYVLRKHGQHDTEQPLPSSQDAAEAE